MSVPKGDYFIYNAVLGSKGEKLAVTFAGKSEHPTLKVLDEDAKEQIVRITVFFIVITSIF